MMLFAPCSPTAMPKAATPSYSLGMKSDAPRALSARKKMRVVQHLKRLGTGNCGT
jgi:hypothetical protein